MAIGWNPYPQLPDPFQTLVALDPARIYKGEGGGGLALSRVKEAGGYEQVRAASLARYGVMYNEVAGPNTEHGLNAAIALPALAKAGRILASNPEGQPSDRERMDFNHFMRSEDSSAGFVLVGRRGYSRDNPIPVVPREVADWGIKDPPGVYEISPQPRPGDPDWFKYFRLEHATLYYRISQPVPQVPPPPAPLPPPASTPPNSAPLEAMVGRLAGQLDRLDQILASATSAPVVGNVNTHSYVELALLLRDADAIELPSGNKGGLPARGLRALRDGVRKVLQDSGR